MLRILAIGCLLGAGVVHLVITPYHYAHAPAHGLFFGLLGIVQVVWAGVFWRWPTSALRVGGLTLSGGVVVLWVLTQMVAIPFADQPEPIDWSLIASKALELAGFVTLVLGNSLACQPIVRAGGVGLGVGVLMWGGGLGGAVLFPQYGHTSHDHTGHDHRNHDHSAESAYADVDLAEETYDWQLPEGFPLPTVPDDNPMTEEKVELGRFLFYDQRLSANQTQSCSACHFQEIAFTDAKAQPVGSTGESHLRNSPTLTNVAYNATLTWSSPTLTELERQLLVPVFGEFPHELGVSGHEDEVLQRFIDDPMYQERFAQAFPDEDDPVTWSNLVKALASFSRALISGNAPYDQYVYGGDKSALSPSAIRGLNLFLSEELECHHCHNGFNFTNSTRHRNTTFKDTPFENTGLYNIDGTGAYPRGNTGLHEITGDPEDMGRFRPPTLRNIELTGPYMHDGSIETLEDVIRFYEDGGRNITSGPHAGDGRLNPNKSGFVPGFVLTDQERADIIEFLESLTDEQFITDPRFSDPFVVDSEAHTPDR